MMELLPVGNHMPTTHPHAVAYITATLSSMVSMGQKEEDSNPPVAHFNIKVLAMAGTCTPVGALTSPSQPIKDAIFAATPASVARLGC